MFARLLVYIDSCLLFLLNLKVSLRMQILAPNGVPQFMPLHHRTNLGYTAQPDNKLQSLPRFRLNPKYIIIHMCVVSESHLLSD